jgi:hypothetical protein
MPRAPGADVLRLVAEHDLPAQRSQAAGDLGLLEVRAADPVPEVQEELGDPAHPDPSDADEVDLDLLVAEHPSPLRWNVRDSIEDNQ